MAGIISSYRLGFIPNTQAQLKDKATVAVVRPLNHVHIVQLFQRRECLAFSPFRDTTDLNLSEMKLIFPCGFECWKTFVCLPIDIGLFHALMKG